MKCFYHGVDLDGQCAGAIVRKWHPECEMIGVDYTDTSASPEPDDGETVFVVDFSFPPDEMLRLYEKCDLVWIDHHKSAISDVVAGGGDGISGLRMIGIAGCELTWLYLSGQRAPEAVRLLGRYDVWDHRDPDVLPFQFGMREEKNTAPEAGLWHFLLNNNRGQSGRRIQEILERGRVILSYQERQNEKYARAMAYEAEFEGLRAVVLNKPMANSMAFDGVFDPEKHDIMVAFGVRGMDMKYSLYSDKPDVDVSEIAKKYGGGGHAGAAGFYTETRVV